MRTFFSILLSLVFFSGLLAQTNGLVEAKHGMVVSASDIASDVGVEILKEGGNAVDAAVATGFALAVTFPSAGNLGGGGFMVIRFPDGTTTTIDYREKAPLSADRDMFLDDNGKFNLEKSTTGTLSSGVPGSVAGLLYVLDKYGTLPLDKIIAPAIKLAEDGFILKKELVNSINNHFDEFVNIPSSKKIFTDNGNKLPNNFKLIQTDLSETLKLILQFGYDGFYKGKTAELIVKQNKNDGGIITLEDLQSYQPVEREPVAGIYKDYKIISMGPPSSGGIALIQTLNLLEEIADPDIKKEYYNKLIYSLKYAYTDRSKHLGDKDYYDVPVNWLISKKYAKYVVDNILFTKSPSENYVPGNPKDLMESEETTHYSVVDKNGMCVSTTTTINSSYGNKVVVDGAGFLLNNEMDDFSAKPGEANQFGLIGGEANSIQPGKRMLSSMTPTIVEKDGKPFIIIGSPGGSTIITTVLQVILNVVDFDMNIYDAIAYRRLHHQAFPNRIDFEKDYKDSDLLQYLGTKGHELGRQRVLGRAQGIVIKDSVYTGATDPRSYGKASGY